MFSPTSFYHRHGRCWITSTAPPSPFLFSTLSALSKTIHNFMLNNSCCQKRFVTGCACIWAALGALPEAASHLLSPSHMQVTELCLLQGCWAQLSWCRAAGALPCAGAAGSVLLFNTDWGCSSADLTSNSTWLGAAASRLAWAQPAVGAAFSLGGPLGWPKLGTSPAAFLPTCAGPTVPAAAQTSMTVVHSSSLFFIPMSMLRITSKLEFELFSISDGLNRLFHLCYGNHVCTSRLLFPFSFCD